MRSLSILFVAMSLCSACSPASVTRIGPAQPAFAKDCDVEVLAPGMTPPRPYRDVGMVTLDNCQDYQSRPCRDWLIQAACGLGGQVAYVQESTRQELNLGQMRFRVMVGAYAGSWLGDPNDPLARSRVCEPLCGAGEVCRNQRCVKEDAAPCAASAAPGDQPAAIRCTE